MADIYRTYNVDKLINNKIEVKRMVAFLYRVKYAFKGEITNKMLNDGDVIVNLYETAIKKGFKPRVKFKIKLRKN